MNIVIILLLFISLNIFAKEPYDNTSIVVPGVAPKEIPINHVFVGSGARYATWYLKLNMKELRGSGLLDVITGKNFKFSKQSAFEIKDTIPENIDKIFLYGNHLKRSGDITLLLNGKFSDSEILGFIQNKLYTVDGISQLKQVSNITTRGNEIYVFELLNATGRHKKKYAARLIQDSFVFTNNLQELRIMLKMEKIELEYLNKRRVIIEEKNDLMVLSINTRVAQKNMGLNLDSDDYVMQSQLFKKATNIVATMHLENSKLFIDGALVSKSIEIAEQLKKILNGVIAYSALSEDSISSLQSQIISKLTVNRDDKIIFVSTNIALPKLESIK